MVYDFQISYRNDGKDTARTTYAGVELVETTAHGAEYALARRLIAAGAPDGPWRSLAGDKECLHGKSIARLAQFTLSEGPDVRLRQVRWVPNPMYRSAAA